MMMIFIIQKLFILIFVLGHRKDWCQDPIVKKDIGTSLKFGEPVVRFGVKV